MQKNYITKLPYTKTNEVLLTIEQANRDLSSGEWLTFLQARENGLQIKKGSKAVHLARVFDTGEVNTAGKDKKAVRHFCVFNISDTQPATITSETVTA